MIFDIIFMFQHYVLYRDKWVHMKKLKKAADREKKMNDYNKLTTDWGRSKWIKLRSEQKNKITDFD
jgi:hypothetical protein